MSAPIATRLIGRTGLEVSELGFGAAPLGNLYAPLDDDAARATLGAAIAAGITYVDTAPYYGFGLSEQRVGDVLRDRSGVVVSTKVGRLLTPTVAAPGPRHGFWSDQPFEPVFDYSYDGVMRSWEQSLQRLGLAHVDILYIHDIGAVTHGEAHARTWNQLTAGGGLRALETLRDVGAVKAIGAGVNEIAVCLDLLGAASLDVILLAGRYTLLEQDALDVLLPACARDGVSVVIGGPYNSGILATGTRGATTPSFDYAPAVEAVIERVRGLEAVCERHGVALAAAALRFPLAHPTVAAVIPGLESAARVAQTLDLYRADIPPDLWTDLKAAGLLRADAPTPGGASR